MILVERVVTKYLNNLVDILVEEEYLGFYETAEKYVNNIYDFINDELSYIYFKKTKSAYKKLGTFYTTYRASKHTSWVIFFENNNAQILVTHITNNHTQEYSKVID